MTHALWGVLLLSLATNAQATGDRTGASTPVNPSTLTVQSRVGPTTEGAATNDAYAADMAECRTVRVTERSNCEREMRAARAQGLYQE